jgi:hypothetical protein
LSIVCQYINDSKGLFSIFNRINAKELMTRLLNTPYSSVKEYLLIDEIEKSLSSKSISDPKYRKALEKVKDVLIKNSREPSNPSASLQ